LPVAPPGGGISGQAALVKYWQNQATFMDGLCQETCRDLGHVGLGFASIINAAETARIQGVDLYGEAKDRLTHSLEFHARYMNGEAVPGNLCGGALADGGGVPPTYEIAYNAYANRLGVALPNLKAFITQRRPTGTKLQMAWETLTHAESGQAPSP
jgi:hypothetical protein